MEMLSIEFLGVLGGVASIAGLIWLIIAHDNKKAEQDRLAEEIAEKLREEIFTTVQHAIDAIETSHKEEVAKAIEEYSAAIKAYGVDQLAEDVSKAIAIIERDGSWPFFGMRDYLHYEEYLQPVSEDLSKILNATPALLGSQELHELSDGLNGLLGYFHKYCEFHSYGYA